MKVKVVRPSELPKEIMYRKPVGIDIETESLDIHSDICLISFYCMNNEAYVVPIKAKQGALDVVLDENEETILKEILSGIKAVGHNLQFDLSRLYLKYGVEIDVLADTLIAARVLQLPKQGLKDIINEINPNVKFPSFDDLFDVNNVYYDLTNPEVVAYSARDSYFPFVILKHFEKQLKPHQDVLKLEYQFLKICYKIQANGLQFNKETFEESIWNIAVEADEAQKELEELIGREIKVNSSKQLGDYLFNELGMEPPLLTAKGSPSTNEDAMNMLQSNYFGNEFFIRVLKTVKKVKHAMSVASSCKKIPESLVNYKVHPVVEQVGFDGTSRVYTKPSVQQYPRELRKSVIPEQGKKFVYLDWSAAELYLASYWAQETLILDWYHSGVDLHSKLSSILLGKDEVTKEEREVSKTITFASIYGSEGDAVARNLNISLDDAQALIRKYWSTLKEIAQLRQDVIMEAKEFGYTKTFIGRRRSLPLIKSHSQQEVKKGERQAFNTAIQASVADFYKKAALKTETMKDVRFVIGVFDSFLLEVPEEWNDAQVKSLVENISDFTNEYPGLKFNYKYAQGHSWGECASQV